MTNMTTMEQQIEECFDQFFQLTFTWSCISFIFAKINDLIIFLLSFTLRFPQIYLILKKKSIKGLSTVSVYVDFISTSCQALYCYHNNLTITIYADIISITFQNFIILVLFWFFSDKESNVPRKRQIFQVIFRLFFLILMGAFYFMCIVKGRLFPNWVWTVMVSSNIPFIGLSRITQMISIVRSKETKSVSSSAFFMRFIKNILKSLSILIETQAYALLVNQIFNASMNITVVLLILIYGKKKKDKKMTEDTEEPEKSGEDVREIHLVSESDVETREVPLIPENSQDSREIALTSHSIN